LHADLIRFVEKTEEQDLRRFLFESTFNFYLS